MPCQGSRPPGHTSPQISPIHLDVIMALHLIMSTATIFLNKEKSKDIALCSISNHFPKKKKKDLILSKVLNMKTTEANCIADPISDANCLAVHTVR